MEELGSFIDHTTYISSDPNKGILVPYDVDGNINSKEIGAVREIHDQLQSVPGYVGIALWGSIIKGYADSTSDVDMRVIFNPVEDLDSNMMREALLQANAKAEVKYGRKFSSMIEIFSEGALIEDLHHENNASLSSSANALALLSRYVIGEKISEMRERIAGELKVLPIEMREQLLTRTVETLVRQESTGQHKMFSRLHILDVQSLAATRKSLWEARVRRLLFDRNNTLQGDKLGYFL